MNPQKTHRYCLSLLLLAISIQASLSAQTQEEDIIELSPFEVVAKEADGYFANSSVVASGFAIENVKNPINIASLSEQLVRDLKFDDLADAIGYISSAQKSPNTGGAFLGSRIQVRGFETQWFNRNGVRRYWINGSDNLDRLEVIKGPAAVFFGQAAPGGVVNYVTKRPSPIASTSVEVNYGTDDYKKIEAQSQGPIFGYKKLAYRVNANYLDKDDWRDYEWQERSFVYGGLLWQPLKNLKFYAEYEWIKDKSNDALGLPQGNPVWAADYMALAKQPESNRILDYFAANPALLPKPAASFPVDYGMPADATREEVLNGARRTIRINNRNVNVNFPGLLSRWRNRDPGSPGGNIQWSQDSKIAWQGLGYSAQEAAERFQRDGVIFPEATPYGWEWNTLGESGFVDQDIQNITLESNWSPFQWFSLRVAAVWDIYNVWAFQNVGQHITAMSADGPLMEGQKLSVDSLGNETFTLVTQGVFIFDTGPANHTFLIGRELFEDHFLSTEMYDTNTITAPADIGSWNYFTQGYPEQSAGSVRVEFIDIGKTAERESYTGNYVLRLWDSKVAAMAGIRRENFISWSQQPNPTTGKREIERDTTVDTPSFGLVYEVVKDFNLFGSYSESYYAYGPSAAYVNKSIGLTTDQIRDYETALGGLRWSNPVTGEGFDIGIKTQWRDNTLSGSIAYYNVKEAGRQAVDDDQSTLDHPLNADYLASKPGTSASQLPVQVRRFLGVTQVEGIDMDLQYRPTSDWTILASYAYLFRSDTTDAFGTVVELIGTPRHGYSIWSKYSFRKGRLSGLGIGLGVNGKTSYYTRPPTANYNYFEDGFIVLDALFEYSLPLARRGELKFALNIKNLLDERYYAGGASNPGEARKVILSSRYTF